MVDLYSPKRSRPVVLIVVGVVVLVAAAFFIGRWVSADAPAPVAVGTDHGPRQLTPQGIPFGYTQDELGARTAALNGLIGGVRLRGQVDGAQLYPMRAKSPDVTPSADLFLNAPPPPLLVIDANKPRPEPKPNPQRAVYDFAPVLEPGETVTGVIATEPQVQLSADLLTANVSFQWIETRTSQAGNTIQGTDFIVRLVWDRGEDWRVLDVGATKVPDAKDVPGWLQPWTFIVSGTQ